MDIRSPAAEGYYVPAEWERHDRCWIQWPARGQRWGERLPEVYRAYAEVARAIAQFEPVSMVVRPEDEAQARLACGRDIDILPIDIDDSWARDTAPIFVARADGQVAGVHWQFNGLGNVQHGYVHDATVGRRILNSLRLQQFEGPMVLEGGAVCVDGYGTLLTCEACLLNDNRNPELTRQQVEELLALFFGARRVVWLSQGLEGDEGGGHVDLMARFCEAGKVLIHTPNDSGDPDFARMADNRARLAGARDGGGRGIDLLDVPAPSQVLRNAAGQRLCLSYLGFYVANGGVVMPAFGDGHDRRAADIIAGAFPGREVVAVPALELALGGGNIHRMTQQQPAAGPSGG